MFVKYIKFIVVTFLFSVVFCNIVRADFDDYVGKCTYASADTGVDTIEVYYGEKKVSAKYVKGAGNTVYELVEKFTADGFWNANTHKCPKNIYGSTILDITGEANSIRYLHLNKKSEVYDLSKEDYYSEDSDDDSNLGSNYDGKCTYAEKENKDVAAFEIYFSVADEKLETRGTDRKLLFNLKDFIDNSDGYCPKKMYGDSSNMGGSIFVDTLSFIKTSSRSVEYVRIDSEYYGDYKKDDGRENRDGSESKNIDSCKELLGEDFINKLNKYLNIIKIAVPIVLVGFGVLDFAKAIFSNEDDMKKVRKTFILRIVAAILFYLLPIFVELILSLANTVWSNINSDICIK